MFMKSLMNKPILIIGILLSSVFLMNRYSEHGVWNRDRLVPTSCRAVLVMLERRIPENWKTACEGNNLNVVVQHIVLKTEPTELPKLRRLLYRELANGLILLAQNSPSDNLERTDGVSFRYLHPKLEIGALTQGKFVVKFSTIKNKEMIKRHLQATVKVKELIK